MLKVSEAYDIQEKVQKLYGIRNSNDLQIRHKHLALLNYLFFQPLQGPLTLQSCKRKLELDNVDNIYEFLENNHLIKRVEKESFLSKELKNLRTRNFYILTPLGVSWLSLSNRPSFEKNYLLNLNNIVLDIIRIKYFEARLLDFKNSLVPENEINISFFINPILEFLKTVGIEKSDQVEEYFNLISRVSLMNNYLEVAKNRLRVEIKMDEERLREKSSIPIWQSSRQAVLNWLENVDLGIS